MWAPPGARSAYAPVRGPLFILFKAKNTLPLEGGGMIIWAPSYFSLGTLLINLLYYLWPLDAVFWDPKYKAHKIWNFTRQLLPKFYLVRLYLVKVWNLSALYRPDLLWTTKKLQPGVINNDNKLIKSVPKKKQEDAQIIIPPPYLKISADMIVSWPPDKDYFNC